MATALRFADGLSPAELEVALFVVEGFSNREIALRRGVSVRTVANQVAAILRKCQVRSRVELMARFARADEDRRLAAEVRRDALRHLAARERIVVERAATGEPNKCIAHDLGVQASTVSTTLTAALRKLGLPSRRALVRTWNATPSPT
jgi:DNA-binding NarL/FixJ family response regulator